MEVFTDQTGSAGLPFDAAGRHLKHRRWSRYEQLDALRGGHGFKLVTREPRADDVRTEGGTLTMSSNMVRTMPEPDTLTAVLQRHLEKSAGPMSEHGMRSGVIMQS